MTAAITAVTGRRGCWCGCRVRSAEAPAGLDLAGFEDAGAPLDEHRAFQTRIDNRIDRHGNRWREYDRQIDVDEHVRSKDVGRVVDLETHLRGLTVAIELRRNVAADPRPQRHVTAVNRHVRRGARRDIVGFRAERVSFDPYAAQIGDPIELVASQNLLTDRDVTLDDKSVRGRGNRDIRRNLPRLFQLFDLHVRHAQRQQPVDGLLKRCACEIDRGGAFSVFVRAIEHVERDDVRLNRRAGFRRRDRGEPLILRDERSGRCRRKGPYVALDADIQPVHPGLIHRDAAEKPQGLGYCGILDRRDTDANQLLLFVAHARLAGGAHHTTNVGRRPLLAGVHRLELHAAVGSTPRFVGSVGGVHRINVVQNLARAHARGAHSLSLVVPGAGEKTGAQGSQQNDGNSGSVHQSILGLTPVTLWCCGCFR